MRDVLIDILVDPVDRAPLRLLDATRGDTGDIERGRLQGSHARSYEIADSIPRFVSTDDVGQRQTERSFDFKWHQRELFTSPAMMAQGRQWLVTRYGFESSVAMSEFMAAQPRVLDAGCGGGYSASLWLQSDWGGQMWVGADISAAVDVARERLGGVRNTHFVQADLMQLPFAPETFDVVFTEGVLHHTPSTERAFHALVPLVRRGGELMFYVYRKKSPVREFTDDFIRDRVSHLPPEAAWDALRPLTQLGEALAGLNAEIELTDPIPLLGIPAGRHDVQRLVYWHFAKLFWNHALSFDENHLVNFDWYHPHYAHRHTEDEIRSWCEAAALRIDHFDMQESGYTVRAVRL
jgi:SAM-dependent methyltransferase